MYLGSSSTRFRPFHSHVQQWPEFWAKSKARKNSFRNIVIRDFRSGIRAAGLESYIQLYSVIFPGNIPASNGIFNIIYLDVMRRFAINRIII